MTEGRFFGLNYGHLGKPIYDTNVQEWKFARHPCTARQFRQLGSLVRAIQPARDYDAPTIRFAVERHQTIKVLSNEFPELLPSTPLLPSLAAESEVIIKGNSLYNPNESNLLAFGKANRTGRRHNRKPSPIVAVAGGQAGESVRLSLLTEELLKWQEDKSITLQSLSARAGEECQWSAFKCPIQQLVFSEAKGASGLDSWLAVRYPQVITILRPTLRSKIEGANLECDHIIDLPNEISSDASFLDVAFNPRNNQQIATIDQKGNWTIWNIATNKYNKKVWGCRKVSDGNVRDGLDTIRLEWGALCWVEDMDWLIVVHRKNLQLFHAAGNPKPIDIPHIVRDKTDDLIIDLRKGPLHTASMFVLTNRALFWIHVHVPKGMNMPSAECLLSWKHFRDPSDISLRLNVLREQQEKEPDETDVSRSISVHKLGYPCLSIEDILVLLYSKANNLTTIFTLRSLSRSPIRAVSASDPVIVRLPLGKSSVTTPNDETNRSYSSTGFKTLSLMPIQHHLRDSQASSGIGQTYIQHDARFYQLSMLLDDGSLVECLYVGAAAHFGFGLPPPNIRNRKAISQAILDLHDDFVVPENIENHSDYSIHLSHHSGPDSYEQISPKTSLKATYTPSLWLSWLSKEICEASRRDSAVRDLAVLLEGIHDTVRDRFRSNALKIETLGQVTNTKCCISDLEKASLDLRSFLHEAPESMTNDTENPDSTNTQRISFTSNLTTPLSASLPTGQQPSVTDFYHSLIATWMDYLGNQVPDRFRIALERSLRDIAVHLCLSSYAMRLIPEIDEDDEVVQDENPTAPLQLVLPVRRRLSVPKVDKGDPSAAKLSSSQPPSQMSADAGFLPSSPLRALPTPEPTPSLRSRSSVSSLASEEDPYSKHLQYITNMEPQPPLPAKPFKWLGDWRIGGDPYDFDWEATQQASISDEEEDEGGGEASTRPQRRRHVDRGRKRPREPTMEPLSQTLPTEPGVNQSLPTYTDARDESGATESLVTASQVEPGRHGGRPGKKKKKRRQGGF